jgi:hypothetical protein
MPQDQARGALAEYFSERIPGPEPYEDDEATEYGSTPEEKAAGVGIDTGAFLSDLLEMGLGVEGVEYGYTAGSVLVRFTDGSEYQWPS